MAVGGLQPERKFRSRARDRTRNIDFATRSLAKVPSSLRSKLGVRRSVHRLQRLSDLAFRKEVYEWRLLQRHGQRGLERVVEDRVAGGVGEVGEHDGVFGAERFGMTRSQI